MISVDLNCDLGESFGAYTIGMDEAVIPLITSANVACGYHAGDPLVMAKTVARCREAGVHVGAHPGFPDLMGFGRRSMNVSPAEAKAYIQYQLGALAAFCRAAGVPLRHVKPHGARLDGNAALAFKIHVVEELLLHLARRDRARIFENAVGKGGLAVVDMGND